MGVPLLAAKAKAAESQYDCLFTLPWRGRVAAEGGGWGERHGQSTYNRSIQTRDGATASAQCDRCRKDFMAAFAPPRNPRHALSPAMPIGRFIVDFACMATRLIVEVDGSQHGEVAGASHDRERTQWLEAEGYRVLRFWNNEVIRNGQGVMEAIYAALYGDRAPRSLTRSRRKRGSEAP
jgi:hypothetical protein